MADVLACQDVLARYASGADWIDAEMFAGVFWADAAIDFGAFQCGKDAYVDMIMGYRDQFSRRWHQFGVPRIRFDGDEARVEVTCIAHLRPAGADQRVDNLFYGRYLMHMALRQGEWRIAALTYMLTLGTSIPISPVEEPPLHKAEGLSLAHPKSLLR